MPLECHILDLYDLLYMYIYLQSEEMFIAPFKTNSAAF